MLTLYTLPGACSLADHIALAWSGLPYQVNVVNRDVIKSPEYLAKNPNGQVPLLEKDNWRVAQNLAILDYIAGAATGANIGPVDTPESRAEFLSWLSFVSADYHKAFSPIFGAARFGLDKAAEEALQKGAIELLRTHYLAKLDQHFAQNQFAFAGRKTVVDAYLWVVTSWAYNFVPTLATDYPNLNAYFERFKADEGVQKALAEQKTSSK
ncbi:glutathione S-transferase family protein [Neisseria sp. Ec49-e6-T10]|uniref:glutathione S-transferase family protein n=1 Tax=Neisseria sp. Ec49-e6-T10 TaxID=3140744 RepID=UPI003EB8A89E